MGELEREMDELSKEYNPPQKWELWVRHDWTRLRLIKPEYKLEFLMRMIHRDHERRVSYLWSEEEINKRCLDVDNDPKYIDKAI